MWQTEFNVKSLSPCRERAGMIMGFFKENITKEVKDMLPELRVLGIGGSPRRGGNSDLLLRSIFKGIGEAGLSGDILHLRDFDYQGCIGCEKCRKDKICTGLNDGMSLLYPHIVRCSGLVLVSPTHNYNITAWMKAFIDRLYCFYIFDRERPGPWSTSFAGQKRKAIIGAICEQESKRDMGFTLEAMRLPLEALGYEIVSELPVLRTFEKGKLGEFPGELARAEEAGKNLAVSLTG